MDVEDLPDATHVAVRGVGGQQRVDVGPRKIRMRHDALRKATRIGERLQPLRLGQRVLRVVARIDMHYGQHLDALGIGHELGHLVRVREQAVVACE